MAAGYGGKAPEYLNKIPGISHSSMEALRSIFDKTYREPRKA